jgi:predicted glutamine amidotransferase
MCRILVLNSKKPVLIKKDLINFAKMCENSKKWQGDGWGIAYLKDDSWDFYKSTESIWEDSKKFDRIPKSNLFVVHARGASFKKHRDNLKYNQPFKYKDLIFAFNGFINGVKLPFPVPGNIGSKKIFNLILKIMKRDRLDLSSNSINKAFQKAIDLIKNNSKLIEAINLCLVTQEKIQAFSFYEKDSDYFNLRYFKDKSRQIIVSSEIKGYNCNYLKKDKIHQFDLLK